MPYSYATYTGNGSTTQFDLTFPYIRKEHVKVYVNYVDTAFTWVNDTRVQLASAPANGLRVEVRRITPVSAPLVDYADGSTLVAADLDTNALQQTYINQEQDDNLQDTVSVNAQGLLDAGGQRITNVGNPTLTQDVATKNYVDGLVAAATIADADYGDITVSGNATAWTIDNGTITSAKIADGTIIDGDISANAEIAVSKLADGAARQLLQTDAAGTGVEWTNNIDVPGTLDVTGTVTLDSTLTVAGNVILPSLNGGPLAGTRNRVINGDMRIDQRNASQTVNSNGNFYSVDRWFGSGVATAGVFTLASSTTAPANFTNSLLATVTTADASIGASNRYILVQRIEGNNVADLGWGTANAKAVVLSFWVRSSLTGTFGGSVRNSATDRSYPFSYSISAANTWEQKTVSIAGDTSGTWLTDTGIGITLSFALGAGSSAKGTAGAWSASNLSSATGAVDLIGTNGATFYITGVQLEPGTVATPFERRSYGQELALCQRYCWVFGNSDNAPFGSGYETATLGKTSAALPVTMRATPTFSSTAANTFSIIDSGSSGRSGTAIALDLASPTAVAVNLTCSGTTANAACILRTASATATMTFNAEL